MREREAATDCGKAFKSHMAHSYETLVLTGLYELPCPQPRPSLSPELCSSRAHSANLHTIYGMISTGTQMVSGTPYLEEKNSLASVYPM
jgi:hypothetical protein